MGNMKKPRALALTLFIACSVGLFFLSPSLKVEEEPEIPVLERHQSPSPEGSPGSSDSVDTIMIGDFEYGKKS